MHETDLTDLLAEHDAAEALERQYRREPTAFGRALTDALTAQPKHPLLAAWRARLLADAELFGSARAPSADSVGGGLWLTVALALMAGTLMKLPAWMDRLDYPAFLANNAAAIIIGALSLWFIVGRQSMHGVTGIDIRMKLALAGILLIAATLYLNLLPMNPTPDTTVLARMYLPVTLWSLLGLVFAGAAWRCAEIRLEYLRWSGELLVYVGMILLGGVVLTLLSMGLFENLLDLDIGDWYLEYAVTYGVTASPIVGAYLIMQMDGADPADRRRLAPLLARAFVPLFLGTVLVLLLAMLLRQQSPLTDRNALITLNGLLLLVLALAVFALTARRGGAAPTLTDRLNLALVACTLLLNLIALAAIVFRLGAYGLTPNRVAVLGTNLLVCGHLLGILWYQSRFAVFRGGESALQRLEAWVAAYLPAYPLWALIVALGFPLLNLTPKP